MPKHRLTLPPALWPSDVKSRFDALAVGVSEGHRRRLASALGRWLKAAADEQLPPDLLTLEILHRRSAGLRPETSGAMRKIVSDVYGGHDVLYAVAPARKPRRNPRAALAFFIARHLAHWPEPWRERAAPLLVLDPEGVEDGRLIRAWAGRTIERRLEALSLHLQFCQTKGLPADVTPASLRADLRARQARIESGDLRIGGTAVHVAALLPLMRVLEPRRNWDWLARTQVAMSKLAAAYPSRNSGRVVELPELRVAGRQMMSVAYEGHLAAKTQRERVDAFLLARTGLAISLLAEAPIRVDSLAAVDLNVHLSESGVLHLSAHETKEGQPDTRQLSEALRGLVAQYLDVHRSVVAPARETRLFVGARGAPIRGERISECLGAALEELFGTRVTAHPVRNAAADFITSEAPEEVGLASTILNHKSRATTESYTATANQVVAGRRSADARDAAAAAVGASDQRPALRRKPVTKEAVARAIAARALRREGRLGR